MNKISSLLKYLYAFGQISEYRYLREVYAQELPEDFLKNNFPYAYSIYESEGTKPATAYISMLNQIKAKFQVETDSDVDEFLRDNNALSFSDIVNLLKSKKEDIKSSEENFYKETGIPEDKISELKFLGASKEEILFILDGETRGNHSIEDAASDLANILRERNYIGSKGIGINQKITDFDYLDDASDYFMELANNLRFADNEISNDSVKNKLLRYYRYIYDGEKDPDHDYSDYAGIQLGGAKANSKIIGRVEDRTIVYSNSMEAAQYWERGSVEIKDGSAKFHLCTSRIYQEGFRRENLYEHYKHFFMFQFIKNFSGEPVFKNEASDDNDLITICFDYNNDNYNYNYNVRWEGSFTVNSKDTPISEDEFKKCFTSTYEAEKALDLCRSFIVSKDSLVIEKNLNTFKSLLEKWEYNDTDICKHLDEDVLQDIIIQMGYKIIFRDVVTLPCVRRKLNDPEVKNLLFKNINTNNPILKNINKFPTIEECLRQEEISPYEFFSCNLYKSPDFKDLKIFNAEKLTTAAFFGKELHEDPDLEDIAISKAKDITPSRFFREKIYEYLNSKDLKIFHAKKLAPDSFFRFNLDKDPDLKEITKINLEKVKEEVEARDFFSINLHQIPELRHLVVEKAKKLPADTFFRLHLETIPQCEHLVAEKIENISPESFFNLRLQKHPMLGHFAVEKAKNISPDSFFDLRLQKIPEFKYLTVQKAENISPNSFFFYQLEKLPECEHLVEEKRESLNNE